MSQQVIYDNVATNLTANSFTRVGYSFNGWNTASDGSGTDYSDQQSVLNIGNTVLYAKWLANTYTITFDANGGKVNNSSVSAGSGIAFGFCIE